MRTTWDVQAIRTWPLLVVGAAVLALPGTASATPAKKLTVAGAIEVVHSHGGKGGRSIDRPFLRVSRHKLYSLRFNGRKPELNGTMRAVVRGKLRGDRLAVSSFKRQPGATASAVKTGPHRTAVILVRYRNDTNPANLLDLAQTRGKVFGNTDSANNFFKEVSNNKISLTGDVFDWRVAPIDLPTTGGQCDWGALGNAAGVPGDPSYTNYDHYMFVFRKPAACGDKPAAAQVPGKISWYPISSGSADGPLHWPIVAHEVGHNLGLGHAGSLICYQDNTITSGHSKVPVSDRCTDAEYGDPYDAMGSDKAVRHHYSGLKKADLGFLTGRVKTVTGDGVYAIQPSVSSSLYTGDQLLRIPVAKAINGNATPNYYVDWRQSFGTFDSFAVNDPGVTGVSVRVGKEIGTINGRSWMMDNNPLLSNGPPVQGPVAVGKTFEDPDTISIKTESISSADSRCAGKACAVVRVSGFRARVERVGATLVYKAGYNQNNDVHVVGSSTKMYVRDESGNAIDAGPGCVPTRPTTESIATGRESPASISTPRMATTSCGLSAPRQRPPSGAARVTIYCMAAAVQTRCSAVTATTSSTACSATTR